jgi:hypothetical protein
MSKAKKLQRYKVFIDSPSRVERYLNEQDGKIEFTIIHTSYDGENLCLVMECQEKLKDGSIYEPDKA